MIDSIQKFQIKMSNFKSIRIRCFQLKYFCPQFNDYYPTAFIIHVSDPLSLSL